METWALWLVRLSAASVLYFWTVWLYQAVRAGWRWMLTELFSNY